MQKYCVTLKNCGVSMQILSTATNISLWLGMLSTGESMLVWEICISPSQFCEPNNALKEKKVFKKEKMLCS